MTRTTRTLTLALSLGLGLAATACRGGDDTTGDDAPPDANVNPDDVEIYDIQQGNVAVGTVVNVRGVVVTAVDRYGVKKGDFWVQEPDGGAYSGVMVRLAELSDVDALAVGDLVDLESVMVEEFSWSTDDTGRSTTQLSRPDGGAIVITNVGQGTVPTPPTVDALAIGQMTDAAARDAEWGKWDGVPFTVENVSIISGIYEIDPEDDPTFVDFGVTGPLKVQASVAAPIDPVTRGDCLASVTGIGSYFFDYKIIPTATADIATGGSGCPADESDAAVCVDGIDNEADGFADCADFSCQVIPECQTETTVAQIQMGTVTGTVALNDVFITAVDDVGTSKGFWVADSLTAAQYNGVYVYTGAALPLGTAIGATADISGNVEEFDLCSPTPCTPTGDTLTEINAREGTGTVTVTAGTNVPVPVTDATPDTLKDITNGEPYEGVLVQLSNVKVTAIDVGDRVTVTDNNGQTIVVDDDAFNYTANTDFPEGTCLATLTGVMSLNVFDDERRLMPRDAGDAVDGGTCN